MSLPAVFGTILETAPADISYLQVEPERGQRWKEWLAEVGGFRVGVVWQGNPNFGWDRFRSLPLAALAPLSDVKGGAACQSAKRTRHGAIASWEGEHGYNGVRDEP
jgi:hypothetical protein